MRGRPLGLLWRSNTSSSIPSLWVGNLAYCLYPQLTDASTGADWLQGPYVYSLYHEQYNFPERVVASLFVTGFLSAGLTAPLVGAWADQQCVSHSALCHPESHTNFGVIHPTVAVSAYASSSASHTHWHAPARSFQSYTSSTLVVS